MRLNPGSARYVPPPAFISAAPQPRKSAAHAAGCRYEDKAGLFIKHWAKGHYYEFRDHPWIEYQEPSGRLKYAQLDFVLLSERDDNLLIIEAKLRHTRDVIPQLDRYAGLIATIHPEKVVSKLEICRYFDASECRMELIPDIRPHNLPYAAVIFEPQTWTESLN